MAFINERVPKEYKKEFAIPNYRTIIPSFWTIDKEKISYCLIIGRMLINQMKNILHS